MNAATHHSTLRTAHVVRPASIDVRNPDTCVSTGAILPYNIGITLITPPVIKLYF